MNRVTSLALALSTCAFLPASASACGGFFCSTSPVDQAGETVVYAFEEDGTLTMSVRVEYDGQDDDFAWIVPVPAPPEISIGSDALFDTLLAATEPRLATRRRTSGVCQTPPACVVEATCASVAPATGCGYSDTGGWSGGYVDPADATPIAPPTEREMPPMDDGVTVYSESTVGPYDTVVLGAATAAEVLVWLADHGYDIPASSEPLLAAYAAQDHVFVALRLSTNAVSRVVQPLTMRMAVDEACLPIRLTAIATVPNLPITAFFLGRERVIPANYSQVDVDVSDPALYPSPDFGVPIAGTWRGLADSALADFGAPAFVTDYAGPTPAVQLALPDVTDLATRTSPASFLRALQVRGYRGDARLLSIFARYLTPPPGMEATAYYNCLVADSGACGVSPRFDPAGLASAIDREVTRPGAAAHALVHRHGYLTRLYTSLRQDQMTVDPVFIPDEGLGDQPSVHVAMYIKDCSADYFPSEAPTHWEVAGVSEPVRPGIEADDHAYCRRLGGVPSYEATGCPDRADTSVWGAQAVLQVGVICGALMLLFGRRRWRR